MLARQDERADSATGSSFSLPPTLSPVNKLRLVFYHLLAMVPAVATLGVALYSTQSLMGMCNMRLLYPDSPNESCQGILSLGPAFLFAVLGGLCWYSCYKLRPVFWEIAHIFLYLLFFVPRLYVRSEEQWDEALNVAQTVLSSFIRTSIVEALRILNLEICVLVMIALAWYSDSPMVSALSSTRECWADIDDPRFMLAFWIGSGWAVAELLASTWQLFKFVPLYRTVERPMLRLDEEDILNDFVEESHVADGQNSSHSDSSLSSGEVSDELEQLSLDELILMREKSELEHQLGDYLENVPPAIITLWRLDTVLWHLGSSLLICASLTESQGCSSLSMAEGDVFRFTPFPSLARVGVTYWVLVLLHGIASTTWMIALPRIGLTTVTYTSMLVGLILLSAGLGRWNALV